MVEELSAPALKRKLETEEVTVVDVREPIEFCLGHIPGAINIPIGELPDALSQYDWDTDIVVVCPVGKLSVQTARLIESYEGVPASVTVSSLEGGYDEWPYDLATPEC